MVIEEMIEKENSLITTELIPLNVKGREFGTLMSVYQKALEQVLETFNLLKGSLSEFYGYDVISHMSHRIKTPQSIIAKMKKKHYELNYNNLIQKINDIAGIRIICQFKNDVETIKKIIRKIPNVKVLKEKDYLKHPKKSGYSAYHMIIETPVEFHDQILPVKVEIQIRTMAMDFWSSAEHKIRYKTNSKLSFIDSKKLSWYAKLLNFLDNKIMKIYQKQMES